MNKRAQVRDASSEGPPDHDGAYEEKHRDQGSLQEHLGEFAGQSRSDLPSYQNCQNHHQDQIPRESKAVLEEKVRMGQRRSQNGQGNHKGHSLQYSDAEGSGA